MHKPLSLPSGAAESLLTELMHDTRLLAESNLMDYSLLLGVHNHAVDTGGLRPTDGDALPGAESGHVAAQVDVPAYYMGLIDVLQEWNMAKRVERWAKILFKGRFAKDVRDGMSAIQPPAYRERFLAGIGYQLGVSEAVEGVA